MKIDNQIKYWKWAGWTLPFVALAGIVFSYWIGTDDLFHKIIVTVCTGFFGVSVFWWWWALEKLSQLIKEKFNFEKKIEILVGEMKSLRRDIKNDLDNR